jgi:predicted metal-dependent enzyme (double-stranded beta helix superfamily)/rhodanese-related sulfurtransferase
MSHPINKLKTFVDAFTASIDDSPKEEDILRHGSELLKDLIKTDNWLPGEYAQPHPEFYQQYLLYVDPYSRFSVVSFVWGPGQVTPIHNHTVWGLVGVLRGAEYAQAYEKINGKYIPVGEPVKMVAGDVEAVSPTVGDLHKVENAFTDEVSISIHVYGANIGKVQRNVFFADGTEKPFISGYANAMPPDLLTISARNMADSTIGSYTYQQVRAALLNRQEIAILDVREEAPFAEAHPLFAANLPLSGIETDVYRRIPNRLTTLVIYDNGEGLAVVAAQRLVRYGYKNVNLFQDGLKGWHGELFRDVNSASKAFGEFVEAKQHTPSLSAEEVQTLIQEKADIVILDARRYDEYNTMNIPTSTSVPGAELVLKVKEITPNANTTVIVNCAGRTRSIIGTQSLVNAGIDNPVYALRNGTIGWTLAGQQLEHGQTRFIDKVTEENKTQAKITSIKVADAAGVRRLTPALLQHLLKDKKRTNYLFDVRSPEEYKSGHLPGFLSAPGGQLVQETDHFSPVRGARIILYDNEEVRANMTASWLAQMAWDVYVLDHVTPNELTDLGNPLAELPVLPDLVKDQIVSTGQLQNWLNDEKSLLVIDLAPAFVYTKGHIPGSWYSLRSQLKDTIKQLTAAEKYVLTSPDGIQAYFALAELAELTSAKVYILDGGTDAWLLGGHKVESGELNSRFASPQIDRYRRPYEGTNNTHEAMQAYLDWEYGLVDQLYCDGTHGFFVIK